MKIRITVAQDEGLDQGLVIGSQTLQVSTKPVADCESCHTLHKGPDAEKMLDTIDTPCRNCGGHSFVPWTKPVCFEEDRANGVASAIDLDEIEAEIVRHVKDTEGIA